MLIDSTIVKADASTGSMVEVGLSPGQYWKKLDHSKRIFKSTPELKEKTKRLGACPRMQIN